MPPALVRVREMAAKRRGPARTTEAKVTLAALYLRVVEKEYGQDTEYDPEAYRPQTREECKPCEVCQLHSMGLLSVHGKEWTVCGPEGKAFREVAGIREGRIQWHSSVVERAVRLWCDKGGVRGKFAKRDFEELRLCLAQTRDVRDPRIQRLEFDVAEVHESESPEFLSVRRSGDNGVPQMEGLSAISEGHGAASKPRGKSGSNGHKRKLRTGKLPVGNGQATNAQPAGQPHDSRGRQNDVPFSVGRGERTGEDHDSGTPEERVDPLPCGHYPREDVVHCRPCPYTSCPHHLYLDVNEDTGAIKFNFPHLEVWEMPYTCSLDVADQGGTTLEAVGAIFNLTRERIRQVEVGGLVKIRTKHRNLLKA